MPQTATGTFGTTTSTSNVSVTGLSFQPKAVIFFGNGRTGTADAVGGASIKPFLGFAASTSDQRSMSGFSADAAATTTTGAGSRNDACVSIQSGASALHGRLSLASFNSDGFSLAVDATFSSSFTVGYVALGGSDLTSVATGSFDTTTSTGDQSVTSLSFQPDALLTVAAGKTVDNTVGTPLTFNVGVTDTAFNQAVCAIASQDGVTTTNTWRYGRSGDGLTTISSSASSHTTRAIVSAWLSNGFTVTHQIAGSSRRIYFLALKGGKYTVGTSATRTDTNDIAVSGFGYQPNGVFVMSHGTTASTAGTSQSHALHSMGASHSVDTGIAMSNWDEDAIVTTGSETATAIRVGSAGDAEVYASITAADAIDGVMRVKSYDSGGLTFVMTDADAAASFFVYLAFGVSATDAMRIIGGGMTVGGQLLD